MECINNLHVKRLGKFKNSSTVAYLETKLCITSLLDCYMRISKHGTCCQFNSTTGKHLQFNSTLFFILTIPQPARAKGNKYSLCSTKKGASIWLNQPKKNQSKIQLRHKSKSSGLLIIRILLPLETRTRCSIQGHENHLTGHHHLLGGGGGVRMSIMVSFSLGVRGTPRTRFRAIM